MRPGRNTGFLVIGLICLAAASSPVSAKTAGHCLECHSRKSIETFSRRADPFPPFSGDSRSVYQMKLDACPGLRSLAEEMFFTESRIVKLDEITRALEEDGWNTESLKKEIAESARSFSDLKDDATVSNQQLSRQASAIRASLQKVYERTVKARDESNRRWLIGLGILFLIGLVVLVGFGYRKIVRMGNLLLVCLLSGAVLSLSSCTPSAETQKRSPDQERLDQSLSLATQITRQMEEASYQANLLAEMSREWSKLEPAAAQKGFELAWKMALASRQKSAQINPFREMISKWPDAEKASRGKVNFDVVLDLRDELRQAEGRSWPLRAIAEEWLQADPQKGRLALEFATGENLTLKDAELRDQELKATAEAWAGIDETRSLEIARSIAAPHLKASALTRIACSTKDRSKAGAIFLEAWTSAERIPLSYSQSEALIQVSAAAAGLFPQDKNAWLGRVLPRIQGLKEEQLRAFALLKLVDHWSLLDSKQAKRLAMEVPAACPGERAYALLCLAKSREVPRDEALTLLREVSAETVKIPDPIELQKLEALTALELVRVEPKEAFRIVPQIKNSFHRSEVLEALALRLSGEDRKIAFQLSEKISFEPIRERCRVAIVNQWMERDRERVDALYGQALQAAGEIADPYRRALILVELGKSWGRVEEGRETGPWKSALISAERITSPSMKAEALEVLAEAWKGSDPATAQAALGRIDPSFIRARTMLGEVQRWAPVDPRQAARLAETMASDYPLEKAMAFKEIGASLKKEQPRLAFDFFEKAFDRILALPKASRGRGLLPSLAMEAGRLDRERTLQFLVKVGEPETKDLLLRDCGSLWAEGDPLFALKAAGEISDGEVRFALYQRIADIEARKALRGQGSGSDQPSLHAFSYWGLGRERAIMDESRAIPQYEKALHEIRKIGDARSRSYLLAGLAAEWAPIDEEKSLQICEEISSEFPEPLSFGLLQIGAQLKKWNRERAEALFQKAVAEAEKIEDPRLTGLRFWQIGRQWQAINRRKGRDLLKKAASETRKSIAMTGKEDPVLIQVLILQFSLDPQGFSTLFEKTDSAALRASVLLGRGKAQAGETVEEDVKILVKALSYAQKARQQRLISEIALAWCGLSPEKGVRTCSQIESKPLLVQTYCRMARIDGLVKKGESKGLLEKALREVPLIEGVTEKMEAVKRIAEAGSAVDQEQAKAAYRAAYRILQASSF
jgi:hypothetical protein